MMVARPQATHPRLRELLAGLVEVPEGQDRAIHGLALDSRAAAEGELFLACAGRRCHGVEFLADVLARGVAAVAYEVGDAADAQTLRRRVESIAGARRVPLLAVPGLSRRVGEIADRFHSRPSRSLTVIGVTGTNGKTSCSHFLAQGLDRPERPVRVIGTLGAGAVGRLEGGALTTPDAVTVHRLLAQMRDQGGATVVMEVSSHGLDQGRVDGVRFDTAVFTNLTRDHLDYHGDMASYAHAKRRLFERPELRRAVLNLGDPYARELLDALTPGVRAVGFRLAGAAAQPAGRDPVPTVSGSALELTRAGLRLRVASPWGEGRLESRLLGRFNAENLLAALAVLLAHEVALDTALERLSQAGTVPGRMEAFGAGEGRPLVVVDYAHTPDALEQVLIALREHCDGELWCVFGCGGERDRGKRPLMGAAAERLADRLVITSDNPRGESPTDIVIDIQRGLRDPDRPYVVRDRREAIAMAVACARPTDVVLVAGKGHETYQDVGGRRLPFSDRAEVLTRLAERGP